MVQPLLVEAPGKLYQTFGFRILITGLEAVRLTVFGVLITDSGHGFVGMAKTFKHSLTAVSAQGAKKRMIRSVPKW